MDHLVVVEWTSLLNSRCHHLSSSVVCKSHIGRFLYTTHSLHNRRRRRQHWRTAGCRKHTSHNRAGRGGTCLRIHHAVRPASSQKLQASLKIKIWSIIKKVNENGQHLVKSRPKLGWTGFATEVTVPSNPLVLPYQAMPSRSLLAPRSRSATASRV